MEKKRYLGIDIGSTTFKAVLLGEDGKVERTVYKRTQPIDSRARSPVLVIARGAARAVAARRSASRSSS